MLFNSIDFAIFLPVVFFIYWFIVNRNLRLQNAFLLVASYFFYGWWDWRFLALIFISSMVDYMVGYFMARQENLSKRKLLLALSIFVNIGFLGFFKYYNFFVESFVDAFSWVGIAVKPGLLHIILPVGISFYTFQTLSYTIDVYRKKIEATHDIIAFFAFVSFFPQLVAGPIERAYNLLPQFSKKRHFDPVKASDGLRQILWGLFKKIVIADNCAYYVNEIFTHYQHYSGSTLVVGVILFSFQIYGDFSGYSDIAIGTARLFGIDLMRNFAYPYFSRDIAEFWRRWHISLTTWFRDYLYIPLGGSRCGTSGVIRNVFIIFIVSGFWHGANWTFLGWGVLHALFFLPLILFKVNRKNLDVVAAQRFFPDLKELGGLLSTFILVTFAWIFFRADNITHALDYISGIFNASIFHHPEKFPVDLFLLIILLIAVEWMQRRKQHGLEIASHKIPVVLRWLIYYTVVIIIIIYAGEPQDFIYFQF